MGTTKRLLAETAIVTLALGGALSAFPAAAQSGPDAAPQRQAVDNDPDDIIVTARMREETIIEAPLSITAMSTEQLEARQITSLPDLAAMTPGLGFEQASSATSSRPIIRGMSQIARTAGDVSNVGVFVDGIYSAGLSGTSLAFDAVERIEVVRGPQAAQYGRNTFAGAINYITKRPGDRFSAGARGLLGEDGWYETSAYLSAPIVQDAIGVRIDAAKNSTGGYFINSVNGERLNKLDAEMVRLGVLLQPTDRFNVFFTGSYNHDRGSPSTLAVVADNSPRRVGKPAGTARSPVQIGRRVSGEIMDYTESYSYDPRAFGSERTSVRLGIIADYDFGPVTLVSRTGYEDRTVETATDLDTTPAGTEFTRGVFTQTAFGGTEDRWEFSQDLRLQASNPAHFDWMIGAYYSDERAIMGDTRFADPALGTGGLTSPAPLNGKLRLDQLDRNKNQFQSLYGLVGYKFDFGLNLTVEGRYTSEHKRVKTLQNNYGSDRGVGVGDPELDATFNYFTPRFIASYQPTRKLNFYVSVAKGTKSGGFNPTALIQAEKTYRPEVNWSYEAGVKGDFFNMLQVTASVYRVDWLDQQLLTFATIPAGTTVTGDTSITTNVAKSQVDGAEVSFSLRPTRYLSFDAAYAYTNARYIDAVSSSFANFVDCAALVHLQCVNGVTTGRLSGNQLAFSPKHQATFGAEATVPLGGKLEFYLRGDLAVSSKKYVDGGNIGYIPGREEVRLRAGLQNDRFKAQAFCQNVTNDRTPLTAFESRDANGNPHYFVRTREPRRCGVSLALTY